MGYALRVDQDWDQAASAERVGTMMIDGEYRPLGAMASTVRRLETVNIGGTEITFDVSKSGGELPEAVRCSLDRLMALAERKTGWDSHGSARLDRSCIRPAVELIVEGFKPCLYPDISLTSVGGLNLSWTCGSGRELEIELSPDGSCDYVYEDGDGEITPDGPVQLEEARRFLAKLHS